MLAINTFDIFSTFFLVAQDLHQDLSLLGIIALSMTIGIGVFQIPSGILAARFGAKMVATIGTAIVGLASILAAGSTDAYQIAGFRLMLGAGLAFLVPPIMSMAPNHLRRGSEGLAVGSIFGANAAGGMIGLVVWVVIAQQIGWQASFVIGGALSLVSALLILFVIPRSQERSDNFRAIVSHLRPFLSRRILILMGVFLLGSQLVFEQELTFIPFFLQSALSVDPALAGLIGSTILLAALAGSPFAGWLYDKKIGFARIVIMLGVTLIVGVSLNALMSTHATLASTIMVGFAGGGLFVLFSNAARQGALTKSETNGSSQYSTMSINYVHSIGMTGVLWVPVLFSSIASAYGYALAWPVIGLCSCILLFSALSAAYGRLRIGKQLPNPER